MYGYKLIDSANSILQFDPANVISMCFYKIAAGKLKEAQQFWDQSNAPSNLTSKTQSAVQKAKPLFLLVRAIIDFNKGLVEKALKSLKEMVNENPRSPPDIWFAIGLCYFKMNNLVKAKLSFEKTIELDPQNSMALVSLGIVQIKNNINDLD